MKIQLQPLRLKGRGVFSLTIDDNPVGELFRMMIEHGASDLHLIAGQVPTYRINGELERLAGTAVLDNQVLRDLLYEITPNPKKEVFESTGDVDFGYEIPGVARFRSNFFNHKHGV